MIKLVKFMNFIVGIILRLLIEKKIISLENIEENLFMFIITKISR